MCASKILFVCLFSKKKKNSTHHRNNSQNLKYFGNLKWKTVGKMFEGECEEFEVNWNAIKSLIITEKLKVIKNTKTWWNYHWVGIQQCLLQLTLKIPPKIFTQIKITISNFSTQSLKHLKIFFIWYKLPFSFNFDTLFINFKVSFSVYKTFIISWKKKKKNHEHHSSIFTHFIFLCLEFCSCFRQQSVLLKGFFLILFFVDFKNCAINLLNTKYFMFFLLFGKRKFISFWVKCFNKKLF